MIKNKPGPEPKRPDDVDKVSCDLLTTHNSFWTPKLWNELPIATRTAGSLPTFRRNLKTSPLQTPS